MSARLHERAPQIRRRAVVRAWEYRQRRHARGVWFDLRRTLAEARRICSIAEVDALALKAEGYRGEPVGARLAPAKEIFFVEEERLARLPSARMIAPHLDAELLAAQRLVLVGFPATRTKHLK